MRANLQTGVPLLARNVRSAEQDCGDYGAGLACYHLMVFTGIRAYKCPEWFACYLRFTMDPKVIFTRDSVFFQMDMRAGTFTRE